MKKLLRKSGREFLQSREFRIGVLGCLVVSMLVCTAFAEGETTGSTATIAAAFQTGFQQMVVDTLNIISAMAPPAISIAGAIFLAKKAMSWFKGMAK